ncbi:MAG: ThuA domain-containing protein [Pseudomonadales bacterium]
MSVGKPHVLVVTGGHHFEADAFFSMFDADPNITWERGEQPEAAARLFRPESAERFDAYVLYDLPGTRFWPGDEAYPPPAALVEDFTRLLEAGTGLVFIHHALFGWPLWEEYMQITGGWFLTQPRLINAMEMPPSGWRTPVPHNLSVATRDHPVVEGIPDRFEIEDEVYLTAPGWEDAVVPLLTSDYDMDPANFVVSRWPMEEWDHPRGTNVVAWAKASGNSPVVGMAAGDGPAAYENAHYRRLVANAIAWVSSVEARAWAREESATRR